MVCYSPHLTFDICCLDTLFGDTVFVSNITARGRMAGPFVWPPPYWHSHHPYRHADALIFDECGRFYRSYTRFLSWLALTATWKHDARFDSCRLLALAAQNHIGSGSSTERYIFHPNMRQWRPKISLRNIHILVEISRTGFDCPAFFKCIWPLMNGRLYPYKQTNLRKAGQ